MSFIALAVEKGDWLLHIRAINVAPNNDSSLIRVDGAGVAGTGVSVNDNPSLDISLGYMFTDNWAVELLADLSSPHTVSAQGLGGFSVPDGTDVVDTNVLPPTVFLQYQFNPKGQVRPYMGVGLNCTLFFSGHQPSPDGGFIQLVAGHGRWFRRPVFEIFHRLP